MDVFLYHRVIKYLKKGQLTVQEHEICKKVGVKDLFWFDDVISQFADISKIECVKCASNESSCPELSEDAIIIVNRLLL